ncbi:MAG: DUF4166 domain-containing protein [Dongiaceae bacterium]
MAAILRRCLSGDRPAAGARSATTELELADYEALFARWNIHTGQREAGPETATVTFERRADSEIWRRRFAGRGFSSAQSPGRGRSERLIVERFGPFAFAFAPVLEVDRLKLVLRRWNLLGLPLPLPLAPTGEAFEFAGDGRFRFHVELRHPLLGLIVRYRGWLAPRG